MKTLGFALFALFLAILCLTLMSPHGYLAIAASYCAILYGLFFLKKESVLPILVGLTVGIEFLSAHRFGTAALVAVLIVGLYEIFAARLRFTSPYARFIVAMLIALLAISALMYPLRGFPDRILGLAIVGLIIGCLSAIHRHTAGASTYELL